MSPINYSKLPTERINPRTRRIDRLPLSRLIGLINKEDQQVARSVSQASRAVARAVALMVTAVRSKGRIIFLGAGTSGRLGILEAAECPPTFGTPPSLVQAYMAGGRSSVFRSKEGAEDKGAEAARIVRKKVNRNDVVIGIAASGVTPFVNEGLKAAKKRKVKTILVTCHPKVKKNVAQVVIAVNTGPEVIAGSTRLKAGTATKLILNSLTVATMIQVGKVYRNLMVDLQPRSNKLKARGARLVSLLGKVSPRQAQSFFKKSKGQTKVAILMARKKIGLKEAQSKLKKAKGHLHKVIG